MYRRRQTKNVSKRIWRDYIGQARDIQHRPQGKEGYSLPSQAIRGVIAEAKEKHGVRGTWLKGLNGVRNWVRTEFVAMNLKKLAMRAQIMPVFCRIILFLHKQEQFGYSILILF